MCNGLVGGGGYFHFEDKQNMETSKRKDHCTLRTDISICDRLDLLQRNEWLSNFSDVANTKIIDILRKKLVELCTDTNN